jgi:hypothetical protein
MSNEVNVSQIGSGTLDPGEGWEVHVWTGSESEYKKERKRARFFTVVPDPDVRVEINGIVQMEITRVWNMVRTTIPPDFKIVNVLQWNVAILNSGGQISAWELLQAETDN